MKKLLILCTVILAVSVASGFASDTTTIMKDEKEKSTESFFQIGGGGYYLPMDKFNDALRRNQIAALDDKLPMLSFGFYSLAKRHRYGIDFDIIWSENAKALTDSGSISGVDVRGFSAVFKSGMNLLNSAQVGIRPMLGVGFFQHAYDFHPRFNDILSHNVDEKLKIRDKGLVLSGGLNIHLHSSGKEKVVDGEKIQFKGGVDLEGGVHYYPLRSLKYMGSTITDGPEMSKYGVYAKLTAAFGSNDKDKNKGKDKKEFLKDFCKECCKE